MTKATQVFAIPLKILREFSLQAVVFVVSVPLVLLIFLGTSALPLWAQSFLPYAAAIAICVLTFAVARGLWRLTKRDLNG